MTKRLVVLLGLLTMGAVVACTAGEETGNTGSADQAFTDEAGAPVPLAEVPSYAVEEVKPNLKMRWSLDGAPVVEGLTQDGVSPILSGYPRRYQLAAVAPSPDHKPVIIMEFGRGDERIRPGDYDCNVGAAPEAVVVVRENQPQDQLITVVTGAPQRPCKVHIEAVQSRLDILGCTSEHRDEARCIHASAMPDSNSDMRWVRGRFEATVGRKDDAASPTRNIRGAFAFMVSEQNPF
jgi:hypothetical protein